jgi:tetratricopeptide (TPR) repeat protein
MKKFLIVLVFLFIVAGCHTEPPIHPSLLPSVDSLMPSSPDSAYNVLNSIPEGSVRTRRDKAYYALLMTQARHKNYVPLRNDSLINIAVDYYRSSRDHDKYAKSLLYKGICVEEMNDPQKAMEIYAEAEKIALQTNDFLTTGLINSQMAWLYQKIYIENQVDIDRYKRSIEYFRLAGHKRNEYSVASLLGQKYRSTAQLDSAYHYLHLALELAREMEDSVALFHNYSLLASTYLIDEDYPHARDMAFYVIENHRSIPISNETYHCLSRAYARLGKADSARIYYEMVSLDQASSSDHRNLLTLVDILKAENNYKEALRYEELSRSLADSIIDESRRMDLYEIEQRYNNQRLENINQRLEYRSRMNHYMIVLISLIAVIVTIIFCVIIDRKHQDINEKISFIEQLKTESALYNNTLLEKLDKQNMVETQLKEVLEKRIQTIRELIDLSYRYGGVPDAFVKQFNKTMNINRLSEGALDDLSEVVNAKYDGVIDYLIEKHSDLNNDDINLIGLLCCGFSATEMSVFYNHGNGKSIYSRKRRLALKLGLDESLDEYVAECLHYCHMQKEAYMAENQ